MRPYACRRTLRVLTFLPCVCGTYPNFWKRPIFFRLCYLTNSPSPAIVGNRSFISQAQPPQFNDTSTPIAPSDSSYIRSLSSITTHSLSSPISQSPAESDTPDYTLRAPDEIDQMRQVYESLPTDSDFRTKQTIELISNAFPFSLDTFQVKALRALCDLSSVVLSAPTGAGKTVIAEMAIYLALCRGQRVFYTTPLKALSNQKFNDCRKLFGAARVGLLTGDVTINRDADVVVMTTEIYRNMLYNEAAEASDGPRITDKLFSVVFDEFHYLNDRDRGTVWEESIISSPSHVLLVALSATMSNVEDVCEWFLAVQGPTALIQSHLRPVPLKFAYCDKIGIVPLFAKDSAEDQGKNKGFHKRGEEPISDRNSLKMHPKLLRRLKTQKANSRPLQPSGEDKKLSMREQYQSRINRRDPFRDIPSFPYVVRLLRKRDMLPCIFFIFSRAGCDKAAAAAGTEKGELLTSAESENVRKRVETFVEENPDMVQQDRIDLAMKGIASHHAGLLPLWKLCVEELFQDGLIKVVFATETLAAGINMPARTTVISALSKRAGEDGFRALTTSEMLQMAGRAGRRGKDVVGHSVVLQSRHEGALEAFKVLTADVDALSSNFSPTYGMVLNLLLTRPLAECRRLVNRSFGNFLRKKDLQREKSGVESEDDPWNERNLQKLQMEKVALLTVLQESRSIVSAVEDNDLRSFLKALERVKAEKSALAYLWQQSSDVNLDSIEDTLTFAPAGTRLLLKEKLTRSKGAERREKRRDYFSAIKAAAGGDQGAELRSFYLLGDETEIEDVLTMDDETENVVEAILVDMYNDNIGVGPGFVAVDVHGQLRLFSHTAVKRIFYDEDEIDSDSFSSSWENVDMPARSHWRSISQEQFVAPLPTELGDVVIKVRAWRDERMLKGDDGDNGNGERTLQKDAEEIKEQKERVEKAVEAVKKEVIYGRDDLDSLLKARRAISTIEGILDGSVDPLGGKRRRKRQRNSKGRYSILDDLQDHTFDKETNVTKGDNISWDEFMALVHVLQHYGFVDDQHAVTSIGEIGAKVRSENELWTSVVLLQPELAEVSPVHLGAILGATQIESGRSDAFVEFEISEEVRDAVGSLAPMRTRMLAIQKEFGADMTVGLDSDLIGLIELWATGVSWVDLLRTTSLQEGDVCRILRRTIDVLRQIQHLPMVSTSLKLNARRSISLLGRFPVTDDRTFWVRNNEIESISES